METYQVTITYKAVINVVVKADGEDGARKLAMGIFTDRVRDKISTTKNVDLVDDNYSDVGVLNLDKSFYSI